MDDLISRQMAIDVIDKILPVDPMKNEYTKGYTVGAALALKYVMQLPSAQPEIIKCKDCKWYNDRERMCNDLMGFGRYWKPNDFCGYGKRRTNEL